jgi:tRNA threonylcarbamoyladenosine biosynthesis protein TsaB
MNVVALDGALGGFSAAVLRADRTLVHRHLDGAIALEKGLGLVLEVMAEAGLSASAVDRLGVSVGPGAFTGLRIAISYAKALAFGWSVPLVGVGSFDAIELGLEDLADLAVISAKAGTASVRARSAGIEHRFSGSTSEVCERVAGVLGKGLMSVVGAPEDVLSGLGERGIAVRTLEIVHPPAVAVALLAAAGLPASSPHAVRADYGEAPPAKIPRTR